MKNLKNVKNALNQVSIRLAQDNELQKLLIIDEYNLEDVKDFKPLPLNELFKQHYISLAPQHQDNLKDLNRNAMLIMVIQYINFNAVDNNIGVNCYLHVAVDYDHNTIYNNQDRALEIVDRIVQDIDGFKLTSAGKITVDSINRIVYDEHTLGYKVSFYFSDQQDNIKKAEI